MTFLKQAIKTLFFIMLFKAEDILPFRRKKEAISGIRLYSHADPLSLQLSDGDAKVLDYCI